jgi:hypothetical protein
MRFVGVDPSLTRTGVYIFTLDGEGTAFSLRSDPRDSDFVRQTRLVASLRTLLAKDDLLCYESFGNAGRYQPSGKFAERIELLGMMKLMMRVHTGVPFFVCPPNRLKQFLADRVSAHKEEMLEKAKACDPKIRNHDEADAFGLASVCRGIVNDCGLKGKQLKVIESLRENNANQSVLVFLRRTGAINCIE